jgi:hypothetical protein
MDGMHFPLEPDYVLKSRSEAMRYLKLAQRDLRQRGEKLQADILSLEDPLRICVAFLVEALAQGQGHFDAKYIQKNQLGLGIGMRVEHFDIDEEILDALEERFGVDAIEDAGHWILKRLQEEDCVFISWALGEVRFIEGQHRMVLENRLLFVLESRKFRAVLSHANWQHPDCIEYLIDGGQKGISFRGVG